MTEVRQDCEKGAKSTAKPDAVSYPSHYTSGGIEAKDALMGRDGRKRAVPDGLLQVELCVQVLVEVRVQERRRGPAQVQAMHRISD